MYCVLYTKTERRHVDVLKRDFFFIVVVCVGDLSGACVNVLKNKLCPSIVVEQWPSPPSYLPFFPESFVSIRQDAQ